MSIGHGRPVWSRSGDGHHVSEVLIGQSYFLRFDPKLWQQMQPYAPLGSMQAAALVRQHGYEVGFFDAMLAASEEAWAAALDRERPRFAVLFEDNFNYLSKMCLLRMREAAFTMSRMARERGCTVIVGGSDATDHAKEHLGRGAGHVLIGEGDATLVELLDSLSGRSGSDLATIPGHAFTGTDGVVVTRRRPDISELDSLPFPAWDLVDVARYRDIWVKRHGEFSMNMATTRGCPFHCNWCAKPIWGQRYNVRSPEHVVGEMRWLKERYRPDHIWFADDIMGLKPGWLPRFADAAEAADARIPFKCLGRADLLLREPDIPALARAGARIVWIGAESGSQRILDRMEKGTTVDQIRGAAARLRQHSVKVGFFLQFGYPGETREDIELTLAMVRQSLPDDVGVSVSYPLPGTPFHERVREQLGPTRNWHDSDDLAMLYQGPFTTAFYRQLHKVVHAEFRARRSALELRTVIGSPRSWRPGHLRRAAGMVRNALALPVLRMRLDAMSRISHAPTPALAPDMARERASTPSPQDRP